VLGATKAVVSVLAEIAGENKGIAVAGGVLFLAGLGIYALMRHSTARKKRGEAGLQQGPPRPSMAERYAEVRNTRDLQAPQYGRRASQTERWPYS
jgi:hypothetical protein